MIQRFKNSKIHPHDSYRGDRDQKFEDFKIKKFVLTAMGQSG